MSEDLVSRAKNPDVIHSLAAMRRAAHMARETAVRTDTDLIVVDDGKVVRITPDELRAEGIR